MNVISLGQTVSKCRASTAAFAILVGTFEAGDGTQFSSICARMRICRFYALATVGTDHDPSRIFEAASQEVLKNKKGFYTNNNIKYKNKPQPNRNLITIKNESGTNPSRTNTAVYVQQTLHIETAMRYSESDCLVIEYAIGFVHNCDANNMFYRMCCLGCW